MRPLWLIYCLLALPLGVQAGALRVIAASGPAAQAQDASHEYALELGDVPPGVLRLRTPAGATLQLRTEDDSTLEMGEQTELRLDPAQRTLVLRQGRLALWSEQGGWSVRVPGHVMRSQGFLRLRVCAPPCAQQPAVLGKADGEVVIEYRGGRSVLRNRLFQMDGSGTRPELLARDNGLLDGAVNFDAAVAAKQRLAERLQAALADFQAERFDAADAALRTLRREAPGEPVIVYYQGLIALQQRRNEDALRDLQQYAREDAQGAAERGIAQLLTVLTSTELQRQVAQAVSQERELAAQPPEPGTIAIQASARQDSADSAMLAKGFAAMVISDLSKVPGLSVLEREKVQKINDELRLNASGLVGGESAVRLGRLLRAERVVVGNVGVEP